MNYLGTRVYTEKDCVLTHGQELASFGKKALIVTGRTSAKKNGSYDDVCKVLEHFGVKYTLFDSVEENPSIETVMKARDLGIESGADFVIGIGGGSPLDAAKAIALMIKHSDCPSSYLYQKDSDSSSLPVVAVPTTCGTGSEVTGVSVLTVHEKQTKASIPHKIFPEMALVDGKYLMSAPSSIIRNTSVDALSHIFESVVHKKAVSGTYDYAEKALSFWSKIKASLVEGRPENEEAATLLMKASTLAGYSIASSGTSIPHGLSYPLTYKKGIPHGKACGYFQAGYLSFAAKEDRDFLLEKAGFKSLDALQEFYDKVCGPEKIAAEDLEMAALVLLENKAKLEMAPFKVDEKVLNQIITFNK